jgi:EasF-like predicted methyltransferase
LETNQADARSSRNLRKIKILLDALERAQKNVNYYALDLMHDELVRTLELVPEGTYKYVRCAGLWGTYDDGLAWLKQPKNAARPKAILSMGSSIGNFTPSDAVAFLAEFAAELTPDDLMLIALDGCQDADKVYHAYNDEKDVTHNFTSNGLRHANRLLGHEAFRTEDWEAVGEFDAEGSRHRAFVVPNKDVIVEGASIKKGERVRIEESYKCKQLGIPSSHLLLEATPYAV